MDEIRGPRGYLNDNRWQGEALTWQKYIEKDIEDSGLEDGDWDDRRMWRIWD